MSWRASCLEKAPGDPYNLSHCNRCWRSVAPIASLPCSSLCPWEPWIEIARTVHIRYVPTRRAQEPPEADEIDEMAMYAGVNLAEVRPQTPGASRRATDSNQFKNTGSTRCMCEKVLINSIYVIQVLKAPIRTVAVNTCAAAAATSSLPQGTPPAHGRRGHGGRATASWVDRRRGYRRGVGERA